MDRSKVLLVEDDVIVLMSAAQSLRDVGLAVIEAETADMAARILKDANEEVAVVFSDIEMPGTLNGLDLARAIANTWPAIAVVLTSGRVLPAPSDMPTAARFVPKPYSLDHITALISNAASPCLQGQPAMLTAKAS